MRKVIAVTGEDEPSGDSREANRGVSGRLDGIRCSA